MDFADEDFEQEEPKAPFQSPETPEQVLANKASRLDLAQITRKVLESKIGKAVDELLERRLGEEVQAIFDEGWEATNNFGEPENRGGKRITLQDRIKIALSKRNGYDREPLIAHLLDKAIKSSVESQVKAHAGEFKKELKEFQKTKMVDRLRAVLDGDLFR